MATILSVQNLSKNFAGIAAVSDVSFTVERGSITALIGPNGSGKTTTIDCISGFTRADVGHVSIDGNDITQRPSHVIARSGLVRTFQTARLYGDLTVLDHMLIANQVAEGTAWWSAILRTANFRRGVEQSRAKARSLLDLFGLGGYADLPASRLSYGQKKLLALGASLVSEPDVVVLDEPLSGVTPAMIERIERAIRDANAQGQTFLIVEHDMNFVVRTCQRIIALESGRIIADGAAAAVMADEKVLESYLGGTVAP
jgi:branched-chain amino acid transport system ATP-binding protein